MIDVYKTVKVKFEKIADVQKFVNVASKYHDLDLRAGRYVIPACSLMGIFSLDLEKPVKLTYLEDDEDKIRADFADWIVGD